MKNYYMLAIASMMLLPLTSEVIAAPDLNGVALAINFYTPSGTTDATVYSSVSLGYDQANVLALGEAPAGTVDLTKGAVSTFAMKFSSLQGSDPLTTKLTLVYTPKIGSEQFPALSYPIQIQDGVVQAQSATNVISPDHRAACQFSVAAKTSSAPVTVSVNCLD